MAKVPKHKDIKMLETQFQTLLQTADTETMNMVRQMVGRRELALYIAKQICGEIGTAVNAEAVAECFGITKDSAYNRISKVNGKGSRGG